MFIHSRIHWKCVNGSGQMVDRARVWKFQLWGKTKVKVTQNRRQIWRPGGGIILDPLKGLESSRFVSEITDCCYLMMSLLMVLLLMHICQCKISRPWMLPKSVAYFCVYRQAYLVTITCRLRTRLDCIQHWKRCKMWSFPVVNAHNSSLTGLRMR